MTTDAYVGEIRIFAGKFAPDGWMFCDGQILPISTNTALFSVIGVMYGGNGKSNFALPDLQLRLPVGQGQGPGLSQYYLGDVGGSSTVVLSSSNLPAHTHQALAVQDPANQKMLEDGRYYSAASGGRGQQGPPMYSASLAPAPVSLNPEAVIPAGQSQPVSTLKPTMAVNYIICTSGVIPPRSGVGAAPAVSMEDVDLDDDLSPAEKI